MVLVDPLLTLATKGYCHEDTRKQVGIRYLLCRSKSSTELMLSAINATLNKASLSLSLNTSGSAISRRKALLIDSPDDTGTTILLPSLWPTVVTVCLAHQACKNMDMKRLYMYQ